MPSSNSIICEYDRALHDFETVYEHGRMVPGLANRNGHRYHTVGRNMKGWGGLLIKSMLLEEVNRWLHSDAIQSKNERTEEFFTQLAHGTNNSSDVEE